MLGQTKKFFKIWCCDAKNNLSPFNKMRLFEKFFTIFDVRWGVVRPSYCSRRAFEADLQLSANSSRLGFNDVAAYVIRSIQKQIFKDFNGIQTCSWLQSHWKPNSCFQRALFCRRSICFKFCVRRPECIVFVTTMPIAYEAFVVFTFFWPSCILYFF